MRERGFLGLSSGDKSRRPKDGTVSRGLACSILRGMKIAVCAKVVPDSQLRLDPQSKRLDRSGEGALNAFDINAVEEALRLKEAGPDVEEVVVVSLGPERGLEAMRKALAMGADRVVLVSDDAAAGSDLVATSRVLATALERQDAELVLFGQQAGDSDGAVLWAAVAERMQRPLISQVAELTRENGNLRGKRQTEYGYDVIEAPLPAVVAVSDAINEPRYPSLKGIMGAKKKPQETLSLGDLGVEAGDAGDAGSRTEVSRSAIRRLAATRSRSTMTARPPRRSSSSCWRRRRFEFLVFLEHHEGALAKDIARAALQGGVSRRRGRGRAPRGRHRGAGRRRGALRGARVHAWTIRCSPRRCRSRGWMHSRHSSARRASTPSCSRRACSRPTSPQASLRGSTPASTGTSRTWSSKRQAHRQATRARRLLYGDVGGRRSRGSRSSVRAPSSRRERRLSRGREVRVAPAGLLARREYARAGARGERGAVDRGCGHVVAGGRGLGYPRTSRSSRSSRRRSAGRWRPRAPSSMRAGTRTRRRSGRPARRSAEALHRLRHLRGDPAQGRDAGLERDRRDQQGSERADLRVRRLRGRRRPERDRPEADRARQAAHGRAKPADFPPPFEPGEFVAAPSDPGTSGSRSAS